MKQPMNFFRIQSEKSLQQVIDTIFDLADAKTEKEAFEANDVYNKIWNLYKHTDEERERKEESRVEGNHVRKVVKPMEERIKMMDVKMEKMDVKMEKMDVKVEKMEAKMEKMEAKMDRMLALLEKR